MAKLLPPLKTRFTDANGVPLAGGKLYSYIANTTTPQATYTDQSAATPNTNPVILDANGSANIWLNDSYYKFILTDATGVTIFTQDNVTLVQDTAASAATSASQAAASATAAANSSTSASSSASSALTSANNASTSATNAATSATNAANSASAASTSATNASNSATTASTQASSATTSASNASTSATNAASSASAASTSATNAANSATSASNSATTFASSTATLTNKTLDDGTTLVQNTTDTTKKVRLDLSGVTTATTRVLTVPDATTTLVGRDTTDTLTNKTLTGNVATTLVSGAATITLPTTTGKLATLANAETLTNKTLVDTLTTFQNSSDTTKKALIDLSGITTGAIRTLTVPNATTTLVGRDTTDTLTNKTLSGNIATNLVSGAATVTLPTVTSTLATLAGTETLTNKTIAAGSNTITGLADANISATAAIAHTKMAALGLSKALVSDASGIVAASTVTSTELGYVSGVTSAIQTQLNGKLVAANNLSDVVTPATARINLGLGAAATLSNATATWNANQIQSVSVSATAPTTNQVLTYNGTNWVPAAAQAGPPAAMYARYTQAYGQSIAAGSIVIVDYNTLDTNLFGTNATVTTGASWNFKANVAMKVRVWGSAMFYMTPGSTTAQFEMLLSKNGSYVGYLDNKTTMVLSAVFMGLHGADVMTLAANDYLSVSIRQGDTGSRGLDTNAQRNYITIEYLGT